MTPFEPKKTEKTLENQVDPTGGMTLYNRNDDLEAPERSRRREQRPPARKDHRTETAAREMTIATPEATAEQQPPSARDAKETIGIIDRSGSVENERRRRRLQLRTAAQNFEEVRRGGPLSDFHF